MFPFALKERLHYLLKKYGASSKKIYKKKKKTPPWLHNTTKYNNETVDRGKKVTVSPHQQPPLVARRGQRTWASCLVASFSLWVRFHICLLLFFVSIQQNSQPPTAKR